MSREVANELDEFITDSVRNTLVGLPLDLGAINIARGRSEGIPSLNVARRQFFAATRDAALKPYDELVRVRPQPEAPGVAGQLRRGLRHRPDDHQRDDAWRASAPRPTIVVAGRTGVHVRPGGDQRPRQRRLLGRRPGRAPGGLRRPARLDVQLRVREAAREPAGRRPLLLPAAHRRPELPVPARRQLASPS